MTAPDIVLLENLTGDRILAQAQTAEGEEFIDAYTALDLEAIDSGRISLPTDGAWAFKHRAREQGLAVTNA